ncbi:MAG TPA: hypothetical protein VJG31_02300 [Candidatus Nanoarchaeia archaeon]|nr:hypothetical protein [Candidatus Nanoarchaeia archaeon]
MVLMTIDICWIEQFTENILSFMKDYRIGKRSLAPYSETKDIFQDRYRGNRPNCASFHREYYINHQRREDGLAFFFAVDGTIRSPPRSKPCLDLEEQIEYTSLSFGLYKEDGRESHESSKVVSVEMGENEKIMKTKVDKRFKKRTGFSLPREEKYLPLLEYTIRFYATGHTDPLPK